MDEVVSDMTELIKDLNEAKADAAYWKKKYMDEITKISKKEAHDETKWNFIRTDEGGD